MHIDIFKMERMQSTWENVVDYNLSESGVHPLNLKELLTPAEIEALTEVELGYTQTNGTSASASGSPASIRGSAWSRS